MRKIRFVLLAAVVLGLASCSTPKTVGYLLDMEYDKAYAAKGAPELKVQPGDKLGIRVTSEDPALSAPFGESATSYQVDSYGYIDFPVLGRINVAGKNVSEVRSEITSGIINSGYIKNPTVNVSMDNFYVTVVGRKNAIVRAEGNSMNMLELVAKTGGTAENTKINDIMVIRTEAGQRQAYSVNLQSINLYDSPVFYLQQNDVVYFKPVGFHMSESGRSIMQFISTGFTLANTVATIMVWLKISQK